LSPTTLMIGKAETTTTIPGVTSRRQARWFECGGGGCASVVVGGARLMRLKAPSVLCAVLAGWL
jgi:hypothetical protein